MGDNPNELRAEAAGLIEQSEDIQSAASAMERDLTDDEVTKCIEFSDKADALNADADKIEAREQLKSRTASARTKQAAPKPAPVVVDALGDTDVQLGQTQQERLDADPMHGFASKNDFLGAVINAGSPTPKIDSRLAGLEMQATAGSDEHSTFDNQYGGFTIPHTIMPGLLKMDPEPDPVAGRTRMIPMQSDRVEINARVDKDHSTSVSGGLRVYRRAEGDLIKDSQMAIEQVSLQSYQLTGAAYATDELLRKSPQSFIALISAGFQDEFNGKLVNERLWGTGVGEYEGIMESPALISITKDTNQKADSITFTNVVAARARCWHYENAIWMANQDTLSTLMTIESPDSSPAWQPSLREDHPDMLLGRPLVFSEYCKSVGEQGDLILVNWGEYLEGIRTPLQTAASVHVRFLYNEHCLKFWMENAGAPWWRSALTPKNGATLSPFVVLDER